MQNDGILNVIKRWIISITEAFKTINHLTAMLFPSGWNKLKNHIFQSDFEARKQNTF